MREADLQTLRGLQLFKKMSARQLTRLTQPASLQRYPQNTLLITEGERADFLHVLLDGCVELFASHNGRQTTIDILRPTTTFILAAVILDQPYLKSARTLLESRVLLLPAEAVRGVFREDPDFAYATIAELALRYRSVTKLLKDQKLRSTPERLANWLLKTASVNGNTGSVTLDFEKKTLASLLGTSPENLSRALAQLEQIGVQTSGRTIAITDLNGLRDYAKPSPLIDDGI
ncbi:MAG: helix-turn-helix domain-containing protein [Xanthobacteraceae bacterium]|nr:helix-turn-helix domain-containing protein [Xanthobacteraceae bacterium]